MDRTHAEKDMFKEGDKWCLGVSRWIEAYKENVAPPVILESTPIFWSELPSPNS